MKKNIGMNVKEPERTCQDKKCPFHGNLKLKQTTFKGVVVSKNTHKTATVEWNYRKFIPKYERYETRRTKIHVHNPPCIDAKVGDMVIIALTRPLAKTKNFVVIENLGREKGFSREIEARAEAKAVIEKKERKNVEEEENASS